MQRRVYRGTMNAEQPWAVYHRDGRPAPQCQLIIVTATVGDARRALRLSRTEFAAYFAAASPKDCHTAKGLPLGGVLVRGLDHGDTVCGSHDWVVVDLPWQQPA